MESRMLLATQSGSVDDFYSLIRASPDILQKVDVVPFIHTPFHEASSTGNINLAMELMILKPSFAKKLNEDGFSPLHLAVENQHDELALELVKFDPSLVRIRGRGGMTPLHLVAKKGRVELLTEFLQACPESIKDANTNGETALHITVMNSRYEELKVITGWLQKTRNSDSTVTETYVLNRRDRKGNTALHLAAHENKHTVVQQLLKCMSLNRNILNKSDRTALDVLRANGPQMERRTEDILKKAGGKRAASLSEAQKMSVFLRKRVTFWEYCTTGMARYRSRMPDGTRNALLVITALIITATYQTATQQKDKNDFSITYSVSNKTWTFKAKDEFDGLDWTESLLKVSELWGFNTISFCAATVLTFILLPVGRAYTWWYVFIMAPLVVSYGISICNDYYSPLFINIYGLILSGCAVYLLVFFVRWTRTTQKKVPKPKSELHSQKIKPMV